MNKKRAQELKEKVRESYKLPARHFADTRKKGFADDFLWAAGQINKDDFVLDAGCGSGRLLDAISISPDKYLGIDASKELIVLAQEDHPSFSFRRRELEDLALSEKADIIFCSAVISHIPGRENRIKALKALLNSTKEGGRMAIGVWKFRGKYRRLLRLARIKRLLGLNPYGWNEIVFDWKGDDGQPLATRYYHYFSKCAFRREISDSGWRIKEIKDSNYNYWVIAEK